MVSIPLFSSPKSSLPSLLFGVFTSRKLALQAPSACSSPAPMFLPKKNHEEPSSPSLSQAKQCPQKYLSPPSLPSTRSKKSSSSSKTQSPSDEKPPRNLPFSHSQLSGILLSFSLCSFLFLLLSPLNAAALSLPKVTQPKLLSLN